MEDLRHLGQLDLEADVLVEIESLCRDVEAERRSSLNAAPSPNLKTRMRIISCEKVMKISLGTLFSN